MSSPVEEYPTDLIFSGLSGLLPISSELLNRWSTQDFCAHDRNGNAINTKCNNNLGIQALILLLVGNEFI
jgi:hypothetical protein